MAKRALSVLRVMLALAILGWLAWTVSADWAEVERLRFDPAPLDVVLAVACGVLALLGLAALFAVEVRVVGHFERRHALFYARIWLQGYFYRYVPGKVMLVVERARLGEAAGIPTATSVMLVFWETLLLLVGAFVLGAAGVGVVGSGPLAGWVLPVAAVVALAGLIAFPAALRVAVRRVRLLRERVPHVVLDVGHGTQVALALGYALVWVLLGASFTFTCRWFEAGADAGGLVALSFVVSYVTGLVLGVTPAGLGIREGLLVAGLSGVYPAPTALAFGVASRVLMTIIEVVLVGLATLVRPPGAPEVP